MKVILYMATTINGYIAKEDDDTSWITQEEWDSYSAIVRKTGNMIIGRRTYYILTKQPEFSELKDVNIAVVCSQKIPTLAPHHTVVNSPKEALEHFKDSEEVIVAGGGNLNASFMKENLINEIYIDIEPIVLGKGIQLFSPDDFEAKLELLETKLLNESTIQLHY